MKKIFLLSKFLALGLLITTFSCKKEVAKNQLTSTLIQKSVDSNFVSMSFASNIAVQSTTMKNGANKQSVNSLLPVQEKQILDSLVLPDATNPTCYVFNYVGGGFTMAAADKRIQPILAYSDKGHFAVPDEQHTSGLNDWLSVNDKNMQILRKNPQIKAPRKVISFWAKFTKKDVLTGKQTVTNLPPEGCIEGWTQYVVGPLLVTSWDQGWPYNDLCPAGHYSNDRTPTGCVATAMAQVMYYHQYPASYPWSSMITSWSGGTPANNYVAQLMLDAGTSVNMEYFDSGSHPHIYDPFIGNEYVIECSTALKNSFGYSSADEGDYNYINVMNNIDYNMPVLLQADDGSTGHEWVCDGYTTWTVQLCDPVTGGEYLFLHMNWGWGTYSSSVNGNYGDDVWTVTVGSETHYYQYNHHMTYNIHP